MLNYNIRLTKEQIYNYPAEVPAKIKEYKEENGDTWYLIDTKEIPSPTTYQKEIVIDIIRSMQQAINPKLYKTSKSLNTVDFLDLAYNMLSLTGLTEKEVFLDDKNFNKNA